MHDLDELVLVEEWPGGGASSWGGVANRSHRIEKLPSRSFTRCLRSLVDFLFEKNVVVDSSEMHRLGLQIPFAFQLSIPHLH